MTSGNAREVPPDISFTATVQAERMRWNEIPETQVTFSGSHGHESVSESRRTGLPERVQAGETYRNVRVDYRLECAFPWPNADARRRVRAGARAR